jgi:transposase-like protein
MQENTLEDLFMSFESLVRVRCRELMNEILQEELEEVLGTSPYERGGKGHRNGVRARQLLTSFGPMELEVPRARLFDESGESREYRSRLLPRSKRLTPTVETLMASIYLTGTSTRKVRVALASVLGGVSKSSVSRALAKMKPAWEAWQLRDLSSLEVIRLIPGLSIVDGNPGLISALQEHWPNMDIQRCTVHKERNLLAYAPEPLKEELKEDYRAMISAPSASEVLALRDQFILKWGQRCPKVVKSLKEAGPWLFTFLRYPPIQWRSIRSTNAIERLNLEYRRRIKVQGLLPSSESVCMMFWAMLAIGAINIRRVDGWQTLAEPPKEIDLAA